MKKPLLFLSIVLTTFSLCAQPTLTPSNSNPIIGEVVTSYDAPYVSPGNAGANQTWDFSSLSGASAGTYSVVSTASTPSGVNFPNSNMCIHADTNYAYFNANSSSFQYVGLSSDTINMSYSNPQDWLRYPMTFNSSYSDDFAVTFNSMSVQFFRKGIAKVTADAYGTLITPVGTFNNTLRVHTILSYKDSANYMGFPIEIIYGEDEYSWYSPGAHHPLLSISSDTTDGGTPDQYSSYYGLSTGVEKNDIFFSLSIFPNPASSNLHFNINAIENKNIEIQLLNTLGSVVKSSIKEKAHTGNNFFNVLVADLPEGIYLARVIVDGIESATRRVVIIK